MSVPTNLIPTKVTGLPEYTGSGTYGYMPYVIDGRTYKVQFSNIAAVGAVPSSRTIATGTGLTGGGDLSQDRTISIAPEGVSFDQLAPSGVVAGVYGSGTAIPVVTVDAKGRVTSATTTPLSISGYVPTSRSVFAGTGLTGGGDLASDVTLAVNFSDNNPQALGTATAGVSTAAARGDHVHPAVDLSDTSQTQGALPLGRGGTGDALSPVAGAVVYSTGTKFALTNPGIAGQVLMSNGVDEPVWATVTGIGTVTSVNASGGTTGLTFTGGPVTTAGTLTLGGTLAVTHGGTGATDAATARSNLGAAASGANSDITSMSGITGAIATPDYIDFDTAATVSRATGRLWWDNADGNQTLSLGMAGSNATLQVGQEMYFRIRASAAITEGQGVMFTGTVGASGALTGAPASGLTKDTASYFMGVATEDIPLNSWGYVTQFGLVRGINTTGGAEAWVDGQILYYNPAVPGGLTKTVPAAPAAKIEVAAVVHAASNGSIFVRPVSRFSLGQLNDLETSAASDLDLLQYNGPAGYWQHKSPSLISVGSATNLVGGAANRIAYQTGAGATGFIVAPTIANTYLEWSGSGFQWSANPLGTVTSVNASGGTTGLTFTGGPVTTAGTLTLGGTLGVANGGTGATSLTSGYLLKGNGTSAVSSSVIYDDGTNVGIGTSSPSTKLTVSSSGVMSRFQTGAATDGRIEFAYNTTDIGYLNMASATQLELYGRSGVALALGAGGSECMRITSAGDVGIGTASPGYKLDARGVIAAGTSGVSSYYIANYNGEILAGVDGSGYYYGVGNGATSNIPITMGDRASYIAFRTSASTAAGSERMRITSAGDVGIGTSSPGDLLHVNGNIRIGAATGANYIYSASTTFLAIQTGINAPLLFLSNNGSTETMRITSAGFVGIGTSSPSSKLTVLDGDIEVNATGLGNTLLSFNGTTANLTVNSSSAPLIFGTNSTERMRITSAGNVGIGATGPSYKLDVAGQTRAYNTASTYGELQLLAQYVGTAGPLAVGQGSDSTGYVVNTANAALVFGNNGTERMRIDASGNVGIGVTPIASDLPTIQSTYGIISGNAQINIAQNAYYSGGWKYTGTAAATLYFQGSGAHNWQIAASGTAGAAISFTQAMTLNTSGNLGIGTTSPSQRLDATVSSGTEGVGLGVTNSLAGGYGSGINFYSFRTDGTTKLTAGAIQMYGQANWADATNTSSNMRFYTVGNNTLGERMRIDASGNVGIGTTSAIYPLVVSNGGAAGLEFSPTAVASAPVIQSYNRSGAAYTQLTYSALRHVFWNSGTERMRIESDGTVQVGGTGETQKLNVITNTGTSGMESSFGISNQVDSNCFIRVSGSASSDKRTTLGPSTSTALVFNTADTERMRIDASGLVGIGMNGQPIRGTLDVSLGNITTAGVERSIHFGYSVVDYYGFKLSNINSPGATAAGTFSIKRGTTAAWIDTIVIDDSGLVGVNASSFVGRFNVSMPSATGGGSVAAWDSTYALFGGVTANAGAVGIGYNSSSGGSISALAPGNSWKTMNYHAANHVFFVSAAEAMRVNTDGKVGIGTSSPNGTLTVFNSATFDARTSGINVHRPSSYGQYGSFAYDGGTTYFSTTYTGGGAGVYGAYSFLAYDSTSTPVTRMVIDASGNVGIGTTGPGVKFEVNSTSNYQAYFKGTDAAGAGGIRTLNSGGSAGVALLTYGPSYAGGSVGSVGADGSVVVQTGNAPMFVGTDAGISQPLYLGTNGSERMRIDASGNVSLGGVAPGTRLDVYSSATDTITAVRNSSVGLRLAAGSTFAGVNAGSVYTTNSVPLVLGTGGSERMRVDTSGNVGIGLTSYSSKLTVAGTIESTTGGVKFPDATTQTTKGIAAAWAQITSITTTSGTTAIFSNIPQTYTALRFAIVGVSHNGGTNGSIRMSVSSDGVTYSAAWNLGASIAAAATIDGALQGDSYTQDTCFFIGDAISSANASPYASVNGTYFMLKVTGGVKYVKFEWSQGASFDAGSITLYGR